MFTSVFGISIKYEAWNHQDSLPVYIAGSYDFHTAYIGNRQLRGACFGVVGKEFNAYA